MYDALLCVWHTAKSVCLTPGCWYRAEILSHRQRDTTKSGSGTLWRKSSRRKAFRSCATHNACASCCCVSITECPCRVSIAANLRDGRLPLTPISLTWSFNVAPHLDKTTRSAYLTKVENWKRWTSSPSSRRRPARRATTLGKPPKLRCILSVPCRSSTGRCWTAKYTD